GCTGGARACGSSRRAKDLTVPEQRRRFRKVSGLSRSRHLNTPPRGKGVPIERGVLALGGAEQNGH
ncbi:unnamed protein product, partial [Ectocarpus sp. 4 AP-2014]